MKRYYVYKLICPITDSVVYIGYTGSPKSRRRDHRSYTKGSNIIEMNNWKMLLKTKSLRPIFEIIDNADSLINIKKKEIYWIKSFRESGIKLFNVSEGGDSVHKLDSHISKKIKGKSYEEIYGKEESSRIKKEISKKSKGINNTNFGGKTITDNWRINQCISQSKVSIIVKDLENNIIGEFKNSKDCAKFLKVGPSLIRECKSKGYLVRHKYKIENL